MNQFCHIELPASDYDKVKQFYGEIFGWKFQQMDNFDYLLYQTPDGVGGGFDKNMKPSSGAGPLIHIQVTEIDSILPRIEQMGGKMVKPKTQISPEIGHYAVFHDCEGNTMGLFQSAGK